MVSANSVNTTISQFSDRACFISSSNRATVLLRSSAFCTGPDCAAPTFIILDMISNYSQKRTSSNFLWSMVARMSAFGGKAEVIQGVAKSPLIAKSRHHHELSIRLLGNLGRPSESSPYWYPPSCTPISAEDRLQIKTPDHLRPGEFNRGDRGGLGEQARRN